MAGGKKSLSATNLAAYHHFSCDLYLYNTYHGTARKSLSVPQNQSSELSKAQFQRGLDWEQCLLAWLDKQQLLLTVPSLTLQGEDLVENILADDRDHFFISGLSLFPPQRDLDRLYTDAGKDPVKFGVAKPDLLEIKRSENGFAWKVIDAKASKSAKTSHHVQIYFYTLCLQYLLPQPLFRPANSASIWLPPEHGFDSHPPSFDDLKTIDISLFSFPVNDFLFHRLPNTLSLPRNNVSWHLNPICKGCPFTSECREQSIKEGRLGSMSNISLSEGRTLKSLLEVWHTSPPVTKHHLTDIEDLATIFEKGESVQKLTSAYPITMRKAKRILALPTRNRMRPVVSPVIEAQKTQKIQVIQRRNYSCPQREDISIVVSVLQDPSSPSADIVSFCISIFSSIPLPSIPQVLYGDGFELIASLAFVIETILVHQANLPTLPSTQFYVWSSAEHAALQTHLINSALAASHLTRDIRLCIGALAQGASLLQTTFQPILLSGALMDFLGKGRRPKAEYQSILERMDLSTEGTVTQLKQRIQNELRKYQNDGGRQEVEEQRRKEIGQVPRVVVLKREVEKSLAFPIPGFWDLPECCEVLELAGDCPSDETLFDAYVRHSSTDKLLEDRNRYVHGVLCSLRQRVSGKDFNLLVNEANPLSANFMDICREEHLRKLFYMQQFEVLTRLSELWRSRIDGCPDAPVLEYHSTREGRNGIMEHVFYLMSGSIDTPASDKERSFFDYILVEDIDCDDPESGNNLPVEALFDDLEVSGLVFPLNQFTRSRWEAQHPTVQKELLLADVRDIDIDGSRTKVVLQTWSLDGGQLTTGTHYRLSPRLVDFNVGKVLSTLFELDLRLASEDGPMPFLQLMLDPKSFKMSDDPNYSMAQEVYRQAGTDLQRLFRELKGLDVESASALVLKASQNRAAQHILANRLTVIWGPPGTGKTHTIALSILRLMNAQDILSHRLNDSSRKIIFMTAMTHAAIEALLKRLSHLIECYRSIENLPTEWLDKIKIEHIKNGNDHPAPSRTRKNHYLYAGTIYQLYNFSKKYSFSVDCVMIDEAGQIALSSAALVLRSLHSTGRIIVAGDSEQLAPILAAQYPKLKTGHIFGSILDCLMHFSQHTKKTNEGVLRPPSPALTESSDGDFSSSQSTVVQLTENFRLNPDLGEFVSTIYSRAFRPQKVQARQLASALGKVEDDIGIDFAVQPKVMEAVQNFFVGLSGAMLRQPQTILKPPPIESRASPSYDMSGSTAEIPPHPISLALLRLETFSTRRKEGIGYEVHVRAEAQVAVALIMSIKRCAPSEDIFVATPHRVQRQAVRAALAAANAYLPMIEAMERLGFGGNKKEAKKPERKGRVTVDTVERLQGSEAAFVICLFSLPASASSDLKFLLERRRLNVAISRAKTLCILVSSSEVLRPPVGVFADDESAKGYAFLRAFEDRAWSGDIKVDVDLIG